MYEYDDDFYLVNPYRASGGGVYEGFLTKIYHPYHPGAIQFNQYVYYVDENVSSITVDVYRVGGTNGPVYVDYFTSNGTAMAGEDYVTTTGTLEFLHADMGPKYIVIDILDDLLNENVHGFYLTLNYPSSSALRGSPANVYVTIDDFEEGYVCFSTTTYSAIEFETGAVITVTRTNGYDTTATVAFATSPGTALVGDYLSTNGTLTFYPGVYPNEASFTLLLTNDTLLEGYETFYISVSNVTGGALLGSVTTAVFNIQDDETLTNVYYEPFTNTGPLGWTVTTNNSNTNGYWRFDDPRTNLNLTGGSGDFAVLSYTFAGWGSNISTELRSPILSFDTGSVFLQFMTYFQYMFWGESAYVDVSLNGTSGPWSNVLTMTDDSYDGPVTLDLTDLVAGETNVMIRFYMNNWGIGTWEIDDFTLLAELDADADGMADWWETMFMGSSTNDPATDADGDGASNLDEYLADTSPTNAASVFEIESISNQSGRQVTFGTSPLRSYTLSSSDDLGSWSDFQTGIAGNGSDLVVTDANDTPTRVYRIEIHNP